jgi:hypothetical protein
MVTPDPRARHRHRIQDRRSSYLPPADWPHPVFHLPAETSAAKLELGRFSEGRTYPHDVEPGTALFAGNKRLPT